MGSDLNSHHLSAILVASEAILNWQAADFIALLKNAAIASQLHPVGEAFATFHPQGISAVILLEESHVALHFWPEYQKISIDIHACDYNQNNFPKAESLAKILTEQISPNSSASEWKYLKISG